MEWINEFGNWVIEFANTPVPIIGCSVLALGIFVFNLISKTSIGKSALSKMNQRIEEAIGDFGKAKEATSADFKKAIEKAEESHEWMVSAMSDLAELKSSLGKSVDELKADYESRLQRAIGAFESLQSLVLEIASNIRNKGVQEAVEGYSPEMPSADEATEIAVAEVESRYEALLLDIAAEVALIRSELESLRGGSGDGAEEND